jgi:hypothetical protein
MVNAPYPALPSPLPDEDELEQERLKESAMNNIIAMLTGKQNNLLNGFSIIKRPPYL